MIGTNSASNLILPESIDFRAYMADTDAKAKVRNASAFSGSLKDRLRQKMNEKKVYLPWEKTMQNFDFRPGEVTLWAGQNGHGKSAATAQVMLSLIGQDQIVGAANFEAKPLTVLQRQARMYAGMNPFSPEFQNGRGLDAIDALYDQFFGWVDRRLWIYDQEGTTDPQLVAGMVKYCATAKGCNHVFIDNLAKVVAGEDDYNGQKAFVDQCTAMARDLGIHIHLVHHLRKPSKETDLPDKHDLKGSGAIADQPDNLILVYRNKKKEIDVRLKGDMSQMKDEPDQILFVRKQRNYEGVADGEPQINLWFERESQQYIAHADDVPQFFVSYPHRPS